MDFDLLKNLFRLDDGKRYSSIKSLAYLTLKRKACKISMQEAQMIC